jgi:hypothetical protein
VKRYHPALGGRDWYTRKRPVPEFTGEGFIKTSEVVIASPYCRACTSQKNADTRRKKIGYATGYRPGTARNIFYNERGSEAGRLTVEAHRARILGELEEVVEVARPWALGYRDAIPNDQDPPDLKAVGVLLKALEVQARVLGTRQVETIADVMVTHYVRRAERIAELVDMLEETPFSHQPQRPVLEVGSNGNGSLRVR